jgi:hypothetical protein
MQPALSTTASSGIPAGLRKNMIATDPPVSEAQRRAMFAAASGNSTLGIPKKVGEEFVGKDAEFNESDHPRAPDGEFGSGSGGSSEPDVAEIKKHSKTFNAVFSGEGTVPEDYFNYAKEKLAETSLGDKINPYDAAYLVTYSGQRHRETNKQLRKGKISRKYYEYVQGVNAALDKLPSTPGTSVRSSSLTPEQLKLYEPGVTIEERGFTSASAKAIDKKFSGYKRNETDVTYEIHGKTARDVSELSNYPDEHEVLFKSGTRFKVVSRQGTHIVMEEVE